MYAEYEAILEFKSANPPVPAVPNDRSKLSNGFSPPINNRINSVRVNPTYIIYNRIERDKDEKKIYSCLSINWFITIYIFSSCLWRYDYKDGSKYK